MGGPDPSRGLLGQNGARKWTFQTIFTKCITLNKKTICVLVSNYYLTILILEEEIIIDQIMKKVKKNKFLILFDKLINKVFKFSFFRC